MIHLFPRKFHLVLIYNSTVRVSQDVVILPLDFYAYIQARQLWLPKILLELA